MKTRLSLTIAIASSLVLAGCNDDDDNSSVTPEQPLAYIFHTDFGKESNWQAGFADYPKGREDEWMLEAEEQAEFLLLSGEQATGFRLQSMNRSDDTKMFLKQKLQGMKSNTWYAVTFDVELASNIAGNGYCSGIGGSPDALTIKLGAATNEPILVEGNNGTEIYNYLNIDLGQQTKRGFDGMAAGNIGIDGLENCDVEYDKFDVKNISTKSYQFQVRTDDHGEAWVIMATDSGYEGFSNIYFTQASISMQEVITEDQQSVTIDYANNTEYSESIAWDYPVGREAEWQIFAQANAAYLDTYDAVQTGHYLHFYNRSDDTGMFIMTPVKGLEAHTNYSVSFSASFATNVGTSCAGIGGAPNEVFVKAGISSDKPSVEIELADENVTGSEDYYRLKMDIGEQISDGEHAVTLSRIGSDLFDYCDPEHDRFDIVEANEFTTTSLDFTTDENGMAWVYLGIDSGFEGPTTIYLDSLNLEISKR